VALRNTFKNILYYSKLQSIGCILISWHWGCTQKNYA